jgi:hypothetical protein
MGLSYWMDWPRFVLSRKGSQNLIRSVCRELDRSKSLLKANHVCVGEISNFPHQHAMLRDNKAASAKGFLLVVACNLKCTDGEPSPSNAHEFLALNTHIAEFQSGLTNMLHIIPHLIILFMGRCRWFVA